MTTLPAPRGPISERLLAALRLPPHEFEINLPEVDEALADEDLQLSLYTCYELHYRGFDGVDAGWEWHPPLLAVRAGLETLFESALRSAIGDPHPDGDGAEMDLELRAILDADSGPSVSRFIETTATIEQVREFMVHRSAYQLKEADPHTWAIPRLSGAPKAAIVEIQADEYGGGRLERVHAELFARSMKAVGLDPSYGAYLDRIPGVTLATVNLMSLCGLHRRLLGAIVGHLALFEMSSSAPNRRYGNGLRRLGFGEDASAFFDEHVLADAVHENIAAVDLAGGLARQEPGIAGTILWGARALGLLEGRWAEHVTDRWAAGDSALLPPP
jgi:hypothetical protein